MSATVFQFSPERTCTWKPRALSTCSKVTWTSATGVLPSDRSNWIHCAPVDFGSGAQARRAPSTIRFQPSTAFSGGSFGSLLDADAGLTSCQLAIGETGTLLLDSSAERHRLVSLLPRLHIALCRADQIVATLGEALARIGEEGPPPTVTLVTGPSRTADIELELVVGVHGPEELHVLLVG